MRKLTIKEFEEKIALIHPKEKLKVISYDGDGKDCEVICLKCGTHYIKRAGYYADKRKVSICKNCFPTQPNKIKENFTPPENYALIEEYKGMHNKVKVRHLECNFIWEITPANLKLGKGCPHCNKKMSKGEQKIRQWLLKNNIEFETQKKVILEGHNLFVDFYLPKKDLYIEYNGKQHYEAIDFFGGEERLEIQKYLDGLKAKYLNNLLVISYLDFEKIEEILESSTTIPRGVGYK